MRIRVTIVLRLVTMAAAAEHLLHRHPRGNRLDALDLHLPAPLGFEG